MSLSQTDARFNYAELLLMPLRGTILLAMLGLAALYFLGYLGGPLGWWLRAISVIAAVRYAQIVVEKLVHGHREPPPVSPHDFNIYYNFGAMGFYALLVILYLLGGAVRSRLGLPAVLVYGGLVTFALPAMLAASVLENSVSSAFNPVRISKIIGAIGWPYVGVIAIVIFGYLASSVLAEVVGWPFLTVVTSLYGVFLLSCAVGRLVFVSRNELGLNITSPQELIEQQNAELDRTSDSNALQMAHQTARLAPKEAAAELWQYHERSKTPLQRKLDSFEGLKKWPTPDTALRFARHLISHLLAEGHINDAVDAVRWCLSQEPQFRLRDADSTYSVGMFAISIGQFKLAAQIMQDMGTRYPHYQNSISALFRVGTIALEKLNHEALLRGVVAQLIKLNVSRENARLLTLERGLVEMVRARA